MDFYAAKQAVEDWCACGWVSPTEIRSLTPEEGRDARMQREKRLEELPNAEIPGLVFDGPIPTDYGLIRAAHQLCAQ
jgi:hypothetical protein